MLLTLGLSLTGYLLPWDQKGYWATKVATNLMSLTPGDPTCKSSSWEAPTTAMPR